MVDLSLTSPDFAAGQPIPARHALDGGNVSPALAWEGLPEGTRSLALVVADPDAPDPAAPKATWTHWVLYNLPARLEGLEQGVRFEPGDALGEEGLNDWKRTGWGGPQPPIGRHRYVFRLYALDTPLSFDTPPTREQLERACRGHVLGEATLMGTFAAEDLARGPSVGAPRTRT